MKLHERIPLLLNIQRIKYIDFSKRQLLKKPIAEVIVSLTSIPSRLGLVHLTIKSLLLQSSMPEQIVLWLHNQAKTHIPNELSALQGPRFTIRFTDLDSPHCKLVPSLLAYPTATIVTCDDDHYYSRNWLKALLKQAKKHPHCIVGQKFREMHFNEDGTPLAYRQWRYSRKLQKCPEKFLALGVAGVLYPPGSLHPDATNSKLYLAHCPKADDLWFKAMAYRAKTPLVATSRMAMFYELVNSQTVTLKKGNINHNQNVTQWKNLCNYFPELKSISGRC